MAPVRRKGGVKGRDKSELRLGDLVLAKVKGYPAWPAKISRPEEWGKDPEPKKFFVQFFGTEEIAFVASPDIQVFTSELKSKLSARCHGNKCFAQAVKEICGAFDVLERDSRTMEYHTDRSIGLSKASADCLQDGLEESNLNHRIGAFDPDSELWGKEASDSGSPDPPPVELFKKAGTPNCDQPHELLTPSGRSSIIKVDVSGRAIEDVKFSRNDEKFLTNDKGSEQGYTTNSFGVDALENGRPNGSLIPNSTDQFECVVEKEADAFKSDSVMEEVKEVKELVHKKRGRLSNVDTRTENASRPRAEMRDKKRQIQSGTGKPNIEADEKLRPAKKSKHVDLQGEGTTIFNLEEMEIDSPDNNVMDGKPVKDSALHDDREILSAFRAQTTKSVIFTKKGNFGSDISSQKGKVASDLRVSRTKSDVSIQTGKVKKDGYIHVVKTSTNHAAQAVKAKRVSTDEALLPLSKRHRRALEAMSNSVPNSNDKVDRSLRDCKNNLSSINGRVSSSQLPKRRAICLFDDDEDTEESKTPVHGGSARKVVAPSPASVASKVNDGHIENSSYQQHVNNHNAPSTIKKSLGTDGSGHVKSSQPCRRSVKRSDSQVSPSPGRSEHEEFLSKDSKITVTSPKRSPHSRLATKPAIEQHKAPWFPVKMPSHASRKKGPGSGKGMALVSDGSITSPNNVSSQKYRATSSAERLKSFSKAASYTSDPAANSTNLETGVDDRSSSLIDVKTPDSMSMKHLIAAAQAKRRQAQLQNLTAHNPALVCVNDAQGTSPNPASAQPFHSSVGTSVNGDLQGSNHPVSLSAYCQQSATCNQVDGEEVQDQRVSSEHGDAEVTLSGGTEAAVVRDAFEGMVETLSRTKESIRRATRLAIECAKHGIANEVVELLIRKLENESSLARKVDLFFLVDSITQCSHSQKGVAGASYVPTIQVVLPRLLSAAAPPVADAHENRRQCVKVLRLWIERKIFPEPVLRCHIDGIGISNDNTFTTLSFRRPSRAERAVNDPIREMEGIFVDEYGSNDTIQLPGLFSSHAFEDDDDEDIPSHSLKENNNDVLSPANPTGSLGDPETPPIDRRHCILEDVDGELEMEDVSMHKKEEQPTSSCSEFDTQQHCLQTLESERNDSIELPPLPDSSPPLPPDSPPSLPPLPLSPPPSPPPLPSLPAPAPAPPPSSPSHPLAPLAQPMRPPPPLAPLPSLPVQSNLPPQPTIAPQVPVQSSPQMAYKPAMHQGHQMIRMTGSAPHGNHMDTVVRSEVFPQQSPCFAPREPSVINPRLLENRQHDIYLNAQVAQQNPHYQSVNTPFMQRSLHSNLPQPASGNFSFTNPPSQHSQHPYPHPYQLSSCPGGERRNGVDEHWRMPSQAGPSFGQEGYLRPPIERPPSSNVGFQPSAASNIPAGTSIPAHGVSRVLPGRPDISGLNCWRAA